MSSLSSYSPAERRLALIAVLIVLFLSALDQTIVSTAMPRIIAELKGLERIAWVGTAYLLASTVMVPIFGKLGDLHGRRPVLIFGVAMFLSGSMLCGLAGEFGTLPLIGDGMNQLIAFRALQGIGAGALTTGAFGTVADIAPPAERGRYTGFFGAMFGLASVAGPVLGGLLTDHATTTVFGHVVSGWRFVFYVNLPIGAVAIWMLLNKLPVVAGHAGGRIDLVGAFWLVVATVPLLLGLSWGGHSYPWDSLPVVGSFALAAIGLAAFILASRGNPQAVVPLDIFTDSVVRRANLALFIVNLAFMGLAMFLPLYLQTVHGVGATESGFALLPLMTGVLVGSMTAGQVARRTQLYKPVLVIGSTVTLVGMALMLLLTQDTPKWQYLLTLGLVGLGMGPAQGMFTLAVQSAVSHARVGVATASTQFFRQIGSTVGVAVFGALLTNHLAAELPRRAPQLSVAGAALDLSRAQTLVMNPRALAAALPGGDAATVAAAGRGLRDSFAMAIQGLFPVSLMLFGLGFAVTLAVPGRKLRGRDPAPAQPAATMPLGTAGEGATA